MQDLRQSEEWASWLAATGWVIERVKTKKDSDLLIFIKKLPFGLAFFKLQRFEEIVDWDDLRRLRKKYRVFWSIMEPASNSVVGDILKHGYRLSKSPYLPTKTRVIDLTKNDKQIIGEMSENFRRILKKKAQIKMEKVTAEEFYQGWKKWATSYILPRSSFDKLVTTFGKKVEFWGAKKDGQILSAIMLLFTYDACFYYQTWTSKEGRSISEHVVLVWETMQRARKLKKKFYNFEGIQDRRFPIARWDGFTEFKRRFGGYEIEYPGSFMKWF